MKKTLLLTAILLGFSACSTDFINSPAPQDEEENLTTVLSTLTFPSKHGNYTLTSPDEFKTATLRGPNGLNEELKAVTPFDGVPLPANGMLLLNKAGYSIWVGNDNTAILKTPKGESKLAQGKFTKAY